MMIGIVCFSFTRSAKASHVLGGEITYKCVKSGTDAGKFVFKLKLYCACYLGAASCPTGTQTINNPLYATYGGTSTITLPLKSFGDISASCFNPANAYKCGTLFSQGGNNAATEYSFESLPVQINGIPDSLGTVFSWASCCRPSVVNLGTASTGYFLRTVMYPYHDPVSNQYRAIGSGTTPACFDGSPEFAAKPAIVVCGNRPVVYQNGAWDNERDSLVYSWSVPLASASNTIVWDTSYADTAQLPTKKIDSNNVAAVLDTTNGNISFTTYSPLGGYHVVSVGVTAYRDNQKLATIYRDMVVVILDCDTGNLANNNAPSISYKPINGTTFQSSFHQNVAVGDVVELDIRAQDQDSLSLSPTTLQSPSIEVLGVAMSSLPNNSTNCNVQPCAYMDSSNNPTFVASEGLFRDTLSVSGRFKWNTSCDLLNDNIVLSGSNVSQTFQFIVRARDNWCPVPNENIGFFTITVYDSNYVKSFWPVNYINASQGGAMVGWKNFTSLGVPSLDLYRSYSPMAQLSQITTINSPSTTSYYDANAKTDSTAVYYSMGNLTASTCNEGYLTRSIHLNADSMGTKAVLGWNRPYANTILFNTGSYDIYRKDLSGSWQFLYSTNYGTEYHQENITTTNEWISYKIEAQDPYGLTSISNIDSVYIHEDTSGSSVPVGRVQLSGIPTVDIYPNPSHDVIFFEDQSGSMIGKSVTLYDILGNEVIQNKVMSKKDRIDVSGLKNGTYFIRYAPGDGAHVTRRIVKM